MTIAFDGVTDERNLLKLYDGLYYAEAQKRLHKIQRDERKLRALGIAANSNPLIRMTFQGPGRTEYGIFITRPGTTA